MMVEGDKWELYIPSELGYGDRGSPPKIKGGDTLIFRMELLEIKGGKVPALQCDFESKEGCNAKETAFIEKIRNKIKSDEEYTAKQIRRLRKMSNGKMNAANKNWIDRRLHILEQAALRQGDASEKEL